MVTNLLFEAATYFANLSNPAVLPNSEAALDQVRKFIAVEEKILALPGVLDELKQLILVPLDPTGSTQNHAMMAGLMLARSGWPSSASALLSAARHPDPWCAVQARLNLSWLAPGVEAVADLQDEIQQQKKTKSAEVPLIVLIEALIRQRNLETLPTIISYLEGGDSEANRAVVLTALVTVCPEQGLQVADELAKKRSGVLALTALGLQAVYHDHQAYAALLQYSAERNNQDATALRWLGRISCPASLPPLLQGLRHPSPGVRCDIVTSLALLGSREAYQAVVQALFDSAQEVADQAMSILFRWFGDDLTSLTQQWIFDPQGRLDATSIRKLEQLVNQSLNHLEPGLRYLGKTPMLPGYNLEYLYLGLLPDHCWYHWVSITGCYQPYDSHKPVLYNFPSLEQMEDWHLAHQTDFAPGGFYYHGSPCNKQ